MTARQGEQEEVRTLHRPKFRMDVGFLNQKCNYRQELRPLGGQGAKGNVQAPIFILSTAMGIPIRGGREES